MGGMLLLRRFIAVVADGSVAFKWVSTSPMLCVFFSRRQEVKQASERSEPEQTVSLAVLRRQTLATYLTTHFWSLFLYRLELLKRRQAC